MRKEIHFPHSLGLLYSAFTYYTGFKVNSGEYKVMGLAPYGEPEYAQLILDNLIDLKADGSFRARHGYFDYCTGLTMTNERFDTLFGAPRAQTGIAADAEAHGPRGFDPGGIGRSRAAAYPQPRRETGMRESLSRRRRGSQLRRQWQGAARRQISSNIWIQPAAGDAGGALGAALAAYHIHAGQPREPTNRARRHVRRVSRASFSPRRHRTRLRRLARGSRASATRVIVTTAAALADGNAVGWFQGRMEFGPRALGNRSIIG